MQDIEFTVQQNKLYMLQTRNGKRTAAASLRIAVEMAREGLIDQQRGGACGSTRQRSTSCCTRRSTRRRSARCWPRACRPAPGAASGAVVFTRRRGREPRAEGRGGDPGAHRDQPRGHPRHARRPRHPHHPRRHDQPRRGGGARHGPALRRRRRRHLGRLRRADALRRRCHASARARSSPSMAPPARCSSALGGDDRAGRCPAISAP